MENLYRDYTEERENAETIEYDFGFIQYQINNDVCHITNIYVRKKNRKFGMSHSMAKDLSENCRAKNIKILTCQCDLTAINPEIALINILSFGFKIVDSSGFIITFVKDI